jgi:hypothetical protein
MPSGRVDVDAGRVHFDRTSNIAACMSVAAQVEYESRVRLKYGALAFFAAVMLVGAQLLSLSGPHSSVDELTLELIYQNKRETIEIIGAVLDLLGLISTGIVLNWLFSVSRARNPGMKPATRWLVVSGAAIAGVMYVVYTVAFASKAHTFVTTGTQGYPEAYTLTDISSLEVMALVFQLGTLLLTIGCIWTSLNMMRVGLVTKMVGYVGIVFGALFLFPLGVLVPVVQGFWMAAVAVTLAGRWPSGDLPAWQQGVAVAWPSSKRVPGPAEQRSRPSRAQQRRKVSDRDVLAAVEQPTSGNGNGTPSPSTSSGKRKRKRK